MSTIEPVPTPDTRDAPEILETLATDIATALEALRRVHAAYERLEDVLYTGAPDVSDGEQYTRYFAWGAVISSLEEDAERLRAALVPAPGNTATSDPNTCSCCGSFLPELPSPRYRSDRAPGSVCWNCSFENGCNHTDNDTTTDQE